MCCDNNDKQTINEFCYIHSVSGDVSIHCVG